MIANLNTATDVVDALGGRVEAARLLEVTPNAVTNWTTAGAFPAELYLMVQGELRQRNLVAPDYLFRMRKRAQTRKPRRK